MKNTVTTFKKQKEENSKISMLTAYDYSMAKLIDQAGINGKMCIRDSWYTDCSVFK